MILVILRRKNYRKQTLFIIVHCGVLKEKNKKVYYVILEMWLVSNLKLSNVLLNLLKGFSKINNSSEHYINKTMLMTIYLQTRV